MIVFAYLLSSSILDSIYRRPTYNQLVTTNSYDCNQSISCMIGQCNSYVYLNAQWFDVPK